MSSSYLTPESIMFEGSDPEDDAPETGEDAVEGLRRMRTASANVNMRQQIARMKESIPSDDEGEFSPIGSPRSGVPNFGGREKFLELKRKLQEDQLNRPKVVSTASDFGNPEDFQWEGVIDVEALLQTIQNEQGGPEQSYASITLNESNAKFVEMHDQIKQRDIKLLDLESKVNELDRQVIDLQDTVSQRDKVISSKNEAVAVIQDKCRREALEKEDELKKTQKTLFDMEKILSSAQVQWKSEKEQLNSELQQHLKRIETLQDTNRELEARNYDFFQFEAEKESLQNAVQEKDQELGLKNCQIDELTAELETSKALVNKLKTNYQTKLKTLKAKQKEAAEKDSLKLVEKDNRISDLEEEKGNLLLQLMDFDEQQASFSGLKNKVDDLEAKVSTGEALVLTLTEKVSQLEEDNSNLSSSLEKSQEEVEKLNTTLTEMEKSSQESRVTLEMRVVELEEERDDIIQKSSYFTEPLHTTSENISTGEEELKLTDRKLISSVSVCTDTSDLVSTCEQTTGTTESGQNTIGAKRARASSGNTIPEEKDEEIFTKASSLFSTPATQTTSFEQQGWSGWPDTEIEPSSTAFQYINLDDESSENFANHPAENIPPYVERSQGHDYPNQVYDVNQWGFDDTADTFVQVKSPFSQENTAHIGGNTYEIENLQTQLGILTSSCDNLKSDLVAKTYECENLEQEIRVLRIDYDQLSSGSEDNNKIKQELRSRNTELNEVQIELEKTRDALNSKESDLASTHTYVAELRSELDDKLSQIATSSHLIESVKLSLVEKDTVIARLTTDVSNFELVVEEKSSAVTDLSEKLEEKSKVISGLRNELKNIQSDYEKLLSNLDERESNISNIGILKTQIAELKGELCQRDEEFEELRKKLSDSENLLDLNEAELMDLRSRENDMIGGYQKISAEFDALQLEYEQVKSELEESKSAAPSSVIHVAEPSVDLKSLIAEKDAELKTKNEELTKVKENYRKAKILLKQERSAKVATLVSNTSGEEQSGSGPQSLSPLPVVDNQKDVEKWQNECMEKETKLGLLQTTLQNMQFQVDELTTLKVQALELVKIKEDEISELNNSLRRNEAEMTHLMENIVALQLKASESNAKEVQVEQLLASLNEAEIEIQRIQKELTLKSNELESMVNPDLLNEIVLQREELEESLKQKDEHIAHLESKMEETLAQNQDQIQFLEGEIWDKNNIISQLNSDVSRLQDDSSRIGAEGEQIKLDVAAGKAENEQLLQKLLELEQERDSYLEQAKSLESLKSELESELKCIQEELKLSSEEKLHLKDEHLAQLESKAEETLALNQDHIQLLEKEIWDKNNFISQLNSDMSRLQDDINRIGAEGEQSKLAVVAAKAENEQLLQKLLELEQERNSYFDQVKSLESSKSELESDMKYIQEKLKLNSKEKQQLKDEHLAHLESKIQETLAINQDQILFLEREIWDKNNFISQLNSDVSRLQDDINRIATDGDQSTLAVVAAKTENEQLLQKFLELEQERNSYLEQVKSLESSKSELESELKYIQENLRLGSEEKLQLKDERIAQLESKIEEILALNRDQIQFLEREIWDKNNFISQLNSDVSRLQDDINRIRTEGEQSKLAVAAENEHLLQRFVELEEERDSYLGQVKSLEYSKSELESEQKCIQEKLKLSSEEKNNLLDQLNTVKLMPRRSTEYQEVEAETSEAQFSSAGEDEKKKLIAECRELKVRNGKMVQKYKQLNDRYNAVTKDHEALKNKNQYSLDGAFEDEVLKEMKQKDELIAENSKTIGEFKLEKDRLNEKVDILERANEKILEMNENQNAYCQQLVNQKKQLEQEISGLKWRLEEVENTFSSQSEAHSGDPEVHPPVREDPQVQMQRDAMMTAAAQEIEYLQQENFRLNSFIQGQVQEVNTMTAATVPPAELLISPTVTAGLSEGNLSESDIENLQKCLESERNEKVILERKIELLQGKILEIEQSEIKCFEEALMLKSWTRQLEMDNLKYQKEMEQIYNSVSDGDMNNLKVKTLQNEVVRLVETLHERDRRCEELTIEITRMLEERDGLQLKLSNVLQHNVSLHEEANKGKESPTSDIPSFDKEVLRMKLTELEGVNFAIKLDLRREREARRLVQEQLLFSQSSRVYRDLTSRNKISFSSPSPPPKLKSASAPQSPQDSPVPVSQGSQPSTPQRI